MSAMRILAMFGNEMRDETGAASLKAPSANPSLQLSAELKSVAAHATRTYAKRKQ